MVESGFWCKLGRLRFASSSSLEVGTISPSGFGVEMFGFDKALE